MQASRISTLVFCALLFIVIGTAPISAGEGADSSSISSVNPPLTLSIQLPSVPDNYSVFSLEWCGELRVRLEVDAINKSIVNSMLLGFELEADDNRPNRKFVFPPRYTTLADAPPLYQVEVQKINEWLEDYAKLIIVEWIREPQEFESRVVTGTILLPPQETRWVL